MTLKRMILMFTSVLLLFGFTMPIHALREMEYWQGMDSTELLFMDKNSPIVVNKETITYDYFEMSKPTYDSKKELLENKNQITLDYELYNPTDETITTTLAYPLGEALDINLVIDITGTLYFYQDTEKYDVTVNGESVEKQLRHTIVRETEQYPYRFSEEDILDEMIESEFYYPELPVTIYSFEVSDVQGTVCPVLTTTLALNSAESQYFSTSQSGRILGNYLHEVWLDREMTFDLYVFGKPLEELPIWTIYHDGTQEEIEGTVTHTNTKEITFEEYVKQTKPTDIEISYVDWYNATINEFKGRKKSFGLLQPISHYRKLSQNLMRWYVFDVTLEPKETITTTIKAPLYPTIQETEKGYDIEFKHLFSTASKDYKEVNVQINTPFDTKDDSLVEHKVGYQLIIDEFTDKDIQFELSKKQLRLIDLSELSFKISITLFAILAIGIQIFLIVLVIRFFWNNRLSNIKKD